MRSIILLGPPGCGKGTQSEKLCEKLKITHISTGDIFRNIVQNEKSERAEKIRGILQRGELVPDDVTVDIVILRLKEKDCENGYLLDGFPRSLKQAEFLDQKNSTPIDAVILIEVDEEKLFKRLTGRRIAKKSGRIYNIYFNPPKVENRCDESGEELIHRDDDKPETVLKRMEVYKSQTMPAVDYYGKSGRLKRVDGEKSIDEVFQQIMEVVGV